MGELGALFNPGMRHELEERQAKEMRREEEGNARDGDLRIDLESGVAVIHGPADDDAAAVAESAPGDEGGRAAHDDSAERTASTDPATARARAGDGPDTGAPPVAEATAATGVGAVDEPGAADEADATGTPRAEDTAEPAQSAATQDAKPTSKLRPRGKRGLSAPRG